MNYFMGIDAGGTKTRIKLTKENGETLFLGDGKSGNINSVGETIMAENLKELIQLGLTQGNIQVADCIGICIGAAGADRTFEKSKYLALIKNLGFKCTVSVVNDAKIALEAATDNPNRILLLSGTGSICIGETEHHENYRCGGWGHILGDEGSGYAIAKKALEHVVKLYDWAQEKTILYDMVLAHYNIDTPVALIQKIYFSADIKKTVAETSAVVNSAYELGDLTAGSILKGGAEDLICLAQNIFNKMNLKKEIDLVYSGSVLRKSAFIRQSVSKGIITCLPQLKIIDQAFDAVDGAIKIAVKEYYKQL